MTVINLVCLVIIAVGSMFFMGTHRKGTYLIDREKRISDDVIKKVNRDSNRLFVAKIAAILCAFASAVPFFLTEELSYNFKLSNVWSPYQILMLLVFAGIVYLGKKGLNDPIKDFPKDEAEDE